MTGTLDMPIVTLAAGTLHVTGVITTGTFVNAGGTAALAAPGGVRATAGYVHTGVATTLNESGIAAPQVTLGRGVLSGSGFILGDLTNAARIDVGGAGAAGLLAVVGNYTQTALGVLNVEIGGAELISQYDFFYVDGTATLGGTLNVSLINGYVPGAGDLFVPVFTGGARSGEFATITGLPITGSRAFFPFYFGNGLVLLAYDF